MIFRRVCKLACQHWDPIWSRGFTASTVKFVKNVVEPDYLATMKPSLPQYDALTVRIKGFDFPVLEKFQEYIHNVCRCMDVSVESTWAYPPQHLLVQRYKPQSTVVDAEYKMLLYERNLKIVNVRTTKLSLLLEVVQTTLPEGVKLHVVEFTPEQETARYIPNLELRSMQKELEDLGGPPEDATPLT